MLKGSIPRVAVILAALALAGCANFEALDAGLDTLKGQNRDVAIQRLGFPDDQKEIAGKDVYIWTTGGTFYQPGSYFGGCSDRYGGIRSMSCVGFMPSTTYAFCEIRVIADKSGTIVDTERRGDAATCEQYANRLQAGVPISAK